MTPVVECAKAHRSIRKFTDQPITQDQLDAILQSGIAASSSSLLQAVSVIRVTDAQKRERLAELAGNQRYVATAAEFLVFIIDYQRHKTLNPEVQTGFTELTIIGAVDAGIMAQNCLLAAESMDLGGVYIGGMRNNPDGVDEVLDLPEGTAVLFGMCLGHPDQTPELKPRLPQEVLVHQDRYRPLDTDAVARYDEVTRAYYAARSGNNKDSGWSEQITTKLAGESRPHMKPYLNRKGLALK